MFAHWDRKEKFGLVTAGMVILFVLGYFGARASNAPEPIVFEKSPASSTATSAEMAVHVTGQVKTPGLYWFKEGERVDDAIKRAGGALESADLQAVNLAAKLQDGTQLEIPGKLKSPEKNAVGTAGATPAREVPPRMPREYLGSGFEPVRPEIKIEPDGSLPETEPPETLYGKGNSLYEDGNSSTYSSVGSGSNFTGEKDPPRTSSTKKELPAPRSISINLASSAELQRLPGVGPATAAAIIEYRRTKGRFGSIDELEAVKGIGPKKLEQMRPYVRL